MPHVKCVPRSIMPVGALWGCCKSSPLPLRFCRWLCCILGVAGSALRCPAVGLVGADVWQKT
eukprot:10609072-Alexandrium_andersonii.AAC.1